MTLPCTVIDYVFQGPVVRFALAGPDGAEVVAHVGADEQLPMLAPRRHRVRRAGSRRRGWPTASRTGNATTRAAEPA